jgi:hypothetical protein
MSSVDPGGPWRAGRRDFKLEGTLTGRENPWDLWGTITTQDQSMSGTVRFSGYKLAVEAGGDTKHDYFGLYGNMNHGIAHGNPSYQPYDPAKNAASVGYYGHSMSLVLELLTEGDVWDSGPASTVGSNTTGFNIGGNLTGGAMGDAAIAQVGVSAGFSASFSSPDVTTAHSEVVKTLRWDIKLPRVGFISPGVPANPLPASYAGYSWTFGAIFQVPKGTNLQLRVAPRVLWLFDWTRGLTNDTKTWEDDQIYTYQPA